MAINHGKGLICLYDMQNKQKINTIKLSYGKAEFKLMTFQFKLKSSLMLFNNAFEIAAYTVNGLLHFV